MRHQREELEDRVERQHRSEADGHVDEDTEAALVEVGEPRTDQHALCSIPGSNLLPQMTICVSGARRESSAAKGQHLVLCDVDESCSYCDGGWLVWDRDRVWGVCVFNYCAGEGAASPAFGAAPQPVPPRVGPADEDGLPEQPLCAPSGAICLPVSPLGRPAIDGRIRQSDSV